MKKLILLLSLFTLINCKTTKNAKSEIYISGYSSEDFNVPSNLFLGFKNDSVFLFNFYGKEVIKFNKPKSKSDTIKVEDEKISVLKTKSFSKYKSYKNDELKSELYFFSFKEEKNKSTDDFLKIVDNKIFQTEIKKTDNSPNSDLKIYKYLGFENENKINIIYDYFYDNELMYSEFKSYEYRILQLNNSLFIQILENDIFPNRIYEVIKLKNNKFTLVHYAETKTIYENYKLIKSKKIESKTYETCTSFRPYEYFNFERDLRYKKGNKHLLQLLTKDAPLTKGNGYITIHFNINCNYEIGRFGLEQMDMNYNTATYDKSLIKHLISEISKIKDWNSNRELNVDVHSFLMFKIENGKIVDLCP